MIYLLIILSLAGIIGGVIGVLTHDYGGTPFIIIGAGSLIFLAWKAWPEKRTKGGEGGE